MLDIFLAEGQLGEPEVSHQDPGEVQTFGRDCQEWQPGR